MGRVVGGVEAGVVGVFVIGGQGEGQTVERVVGLAVGDPPFVRLERIADGETGGEQATGQYNRENFL